MYDIREREFAPLLSICDHYPKMLITFDEDLPTTLNGVRQVNALNFLIDTNHLQENVKWLMRN